MAIFAALAVGNLVYPSVWFADGTTGRVVDASTGAPIEGAVVVMTWKLQGLEGYPIGYLQSFETTTDARGEFAAPGFGPRFNFGQGRLEKTQPNIRILARDHEPLREPNLPDSGSAWFYAGATFDGKTFRLRPIGPTTDLDAAITLFDDDFSFVNHRTHATARFPLTSKLLDELARQSVARRDRS